MSNQNTSFNEIGADILKPSTLVEVRPNYKRQGIVSYPQRTLLIVQKLATGTAPALILREITRDEDGAAFFGAGSIGDRMCRGYRRANRTQPLFAIALDDIGAGVQATQTITFTGVATASGTLPVYVGGERVAVGVTSGMTATQVAAAVVTAATANLALQMTAASAAGVVTLTAKHKGASGNDIDVRIGRFIDDVVPAGLTAVVAAGVAGATNPNIQTAFDAIVGQWFTDIVTAWTDGANLTIVATELALRYRAQGRRDGHGYAAFRGTYGQLGTAGGLTNSQLMTPIGFNRPGPSPWEIAAVLAGVAAFHLTNDPARQLRTLALPGIWADPRDVFTEQEQDLLLRQGMSTWNMLADGTVSLDRVITMYKQAPSGAADRAWLDIMVPKTMSRIRYDWITHVTLLYPRHKLADDYSPAADASDAVVTPRRMAGTWASRCKLYERAAWIEDVSRTVEESNFYRSASDRNRLESSQQVQIIGNLMVFAVALEFQV